MACFIVPAAEAVVVTIIEKVNKKKEAAETVSGETVKKHEGRIPWSKKLHWLTTLLWGGVALLAFEHLWHGEIVPWFPFLSAAADPADAAAMFREMATVGVCMALIVTGVWICMCVAAEAIAKKKTAEETGSEQ